MPPYCFFLSRCRRQAERNSLTRTAVSSGFSSGKKWPPFIRCPCALLPDAERTTVFCVERVERASFSPEMQHRAVDLPGRFLVGAIVFDVDRCRGSIFLADAVNASWITISRDILIENFWREGTVPERVVEHGLRRAEQIAFRKRGLLRQQNPRPVGLREARV